MHINRLAFIEDQLSHTLAGATNSFILETACEVLATLAQRAAATSLERRKEARLVAGLDAALTLTSADSVRRAQTGFPIARRGERTQVFPAPPRGYSVRCISVEDGLRNARQF